LQIEMTLSIIIHFAILFRGAAPRRITPGTRPMRFSTRLIVPMVLPVMATTSAVAGVAEPDAPLADVPLAGALPAAVLFATVAAIALAFVLARARARPLDRMAEAVDAFARGEPLKLPQGPGAGIRGLAASLRRMADRIEERHAALRRNAELLDKTIASIVDAVLVIDREGEIVFTNPAFRALFGSRDDVGSEEWRRDYHRFRMDGVTPLPPAESPIGRAQRGESFDAIEVIMRREGEAKDNFIVASGRPIRDADGRFDGGVIVYRDLTETRETERQLRQAQKL